jgi:hypothetical protein
MRDRTVEERIRRGLRETRDEEPPSLLDRRVRAMLRETSPPVAPYLRPVPATGVALAALMALLWLVASLLADAGVVETAPLIAVAIVWLWLALSTAATLPLLLLARSRIRTGAEEPGP